MTAVDSAYTKVRVATADREQAGRQHCRGSFTAERLVPRPGER